MTDAEKWDIVHKYAKLVRRQLAKPLTCQHCDHELITRIGDDDAPMFECFGCGTLTTPGTNMYATLRAVVTEHFV